MHLVERLNYCSVGMIYPCDGVFYWSVEVLDPGVGVRNLKSEVLNVNVVEAQPQSRRSRPHRKSIGPHRRRAERQRNSSEPRS